MSRPGENIYQWDINFAIASGSYKIKIHDNSGNLSLSQKFSIVGSVLQAPSPVLSPSSGYYSPGQKISMECGNGAQIRYTTDGNIPTENSTLYTSEIILATTTTIKARSFKTGMNPSQIVTVPYFIGEPLQQIRIEQKYGIAPYAYNFFPLHFWKDDNWNETFQSYNSVYSGSDIFIKFHQEYRESTKERFAYSKTEPTTVNNYLNYSQYEPYSTTGIDHYIANFLPSYIATINAVYEDGVILSSDTVSFSDPWLYDLVHPVLGKRNRGIDAIFYPHVFPFSPNTSESGPGSDYRGVLPNQSFLNNVYYKVRYLPRKIFINSTGRNHWFYLYNWSSNGKANFNTPNSNQTGVVFTADIAQIYAHIKGTQLSTSSNAFNSTNQRKFVRSGNGMLHLVYESMSKVWYETSSDNGANWKIMNGGKPLSINNSQSPSIALDDINWAYITYYNSELGTMEMQCFNYNTDVNMGSLIKEFYIEQPQMSPVITCDTQGDYILIVFKANTIDIPAGIQTPGLYSALAEYNSADDVFRWVGNVKKITGTDEYSLNPAMDCYIPKYAPYVYHLAWQQNTETATSQIKYCKLTNTNGVVTQNDDATVSNLSYANNSVPSVIVLKDGIPRVSWTAVNGLTKRAMLRGRTSAPGNPWSGTFSSFGSNVTSVNINKHLVGTVGGYILGWNQGTASWFIRNTNFSEIVNTSLFGSNMQINNGTLSQDFSIMYGIVFDASNLPYHFQQSPALNVNPPLSKEGSDNLVLETRAAVVTTEDNKYTYSIGNIIADDVSINFKEVSDTVSSFNIMDLNNVMITEEFSISDESIIRFSIGSQVLDSLKAVTELQNNNVTFRAELIDADQQKVLFILDDLKFNETTETFNDTKNYELNTAGLGTRTVKVRLVTENSFPAKFYIENHYDQTFLLEKEKYVELTNYQNIVIKDYELFQNYPNPFNPATTITYQLPKAGFVTLKIFDMIGKEVAVLADGFKQEGQYSVDFNAGNLSSGLYFYELKVNDFSATKKMMLIK